MFKIMDIMFIIVPIFIAIVFILVIVTMISPKFRGKMMSKQIKATKYMMEEVKDDLADMSSIAIKTGKKIVDENEDTLRDLANKNANIKKDVLETTVRAIKKGFTEEEKVFCKYCGSKINNDSKFCKNCGKEL